MLKILAKAPWKMTDISYILRQTYEKSLHALKAFPNFSLVCSYWKRGEKIERVSNWCSVLVFGVHRFQCHSFWMLPLIFFFFFFKFLDAMNIQIAQVRGHSVHWGVNSASKTPPNSFSPSSLLNLQTVQAPFLGNPPIYWFSMNSSPLP